MTEPSNSSDGQPNNAGADDEISLLDLLIIFAKHKRLTLGLPLVFAVVAAGFGLWMPDIYTATTKLLPPQQSQSTTSTLLAALSNLSSLGGSKGSNDVYIAMLKSRTLEDRLKERGFIGGDPSQARTGPPEKVTITSDRAGLIDIEVAGPDPKRAAELANAYVEELVRFTQVLAVTSASQRRLFYERQVAQAKDNLAKVEVAARQALERGGLVSVEEQGRAMIVAIGTLRGQIAAKGVQIGAMRTFATDRNSDLHRAQQELESMKRELARIEGASSVGAGAAENATDRKSLDNLRLLRDLKYHETIFELLAKQYELAKVEEANDSSVIQVMDKAVEPKKNSGPKRGMIVLLAVLAGLIVGMAWAVVREATANASRDPRQAERLKALRRYLAWR